MIAASEPLEFIPHGRQSLVRHPGSVLKSASSSYPFAPDSLLHKLKNVAISEYQDCPPFHMNLHNDTLKEWWCVREICSSKSKNDSSNGNQPFENALHSKLNNSYTQNFLKTNFESQTPYNKKSSFSIPCSKRTSNSKTDCCYEEELYVKGKTAIWSRGLLSNPETKFNESESRITIKAYTCETNIKHALFCNFHSSVNDRLIFDALNNLNNEFKSRVDTKNPFEEVCYSLIPSICIIDSTSLRVFTEKGEDFVTSLQFQIKSAWSTKYGILLEKEAMPKCQNSFMRHTLRTPVRNCDFSTKSFVNRTNVESAMKQSSIFSPDPFDRANSNMTELEIPLPTCFSLSHPLDEMAPTLIKSSHGIQYYNDGNMEIVFVSESPSLCLVYNNKSGLHSLYKIRKATHEECHLSCGNLNRTSTLFSQSTNFNFGENTPNFNSTIPRGNVPKNVTSSWLGGISSPFTSKLNHSNSSNLHSKNSNSMAGMFNKLGLTPHTSIGQASNSSMQTTNINRIEPIQPLYPDICFEHIWTENKISHVTTAAAKKAFLHCDLIGQNYLCYLLCVGMKQLVIARLEKTHVSTNNVLNKQFIVGVVTSIQAKDAVNVPLLNMIAVIDLSGNIILYSGISMIGKVHIGGVLAGLINSPYNQIKKFDSPFPRRSSLLPMMSRDKPIDDPFHQLSPVPHSYGSHFATDKGFDSTGLQKLRDPIENRITLEYDRGSFYRITLPDIASSFLVHKCLIALKQILPKDIFIQIISKWYGTRNAPGTQDLCPKLEWSMFVSLIFNLLGYDISKLTIIKQPEIGSTEIVSKKQKTSNDGSQEDWEYLLNSGHHVSFGTSLANMLNLKKSNKSDSKMPNSGFELNPVHKLAELTKLTHAVSEMDTTSQEYSVHNVKNVEFNYGSLLFPHILQILFSLHLLYEELKLNILLIEDLQPLAQFLYQLCVDLRLDAYIVHYWKDCPNSCNLYYDANQRQISEINLKKIIQPVYFSSEPPSIFNHLYLLLQKDTKTKYPFINSVNITSRDIIEIVSLVTNGKIGETQTIASKESTMGSNEDIDISTSSSVEESAILLLCQKGYCLGDIQNFPPSINLFLLNIISHIKANPPVDWPHEAYSLIMREDLALQAKYETHNIASLIKDSDKDNAFSQNKNFDIEHLPSSSKTNNDNEKNTGLEHIDTKILRLRFPDDHRVVEMSNLLQSSIPVTIALTQRPEVSDHDFIEEQERYLYALCTRTMALPVGRGMVTLRSAPCVVTEPLQIPKLCATGRAPPRNATIELSHIEVPPHYSAWPLFHNGVAAGLKLVPMGTSKIDSAWVVYNKPKQGTVDMLFEHAGFLMALGLNGHLKDMAFMDVYEYLVKCHEMTSVGLLLGIAATYRGTMDISTTKLMGIHVEALLPPTSIELDIPQNIQVAALLGVGLLYQRTAHTHITQVLLSEIGRPPGPEMENSSEREGYSLAAGLGLGLVCLGAYKTAPHYLTATLRHYMLGGNKRPLTGAQKEKYKLPSFQIREGPTVNLDVTAPGATLALGMLYLKSGNLEVAKWLAPPPTHYLLDFVRPDLLLLRVIARGLILWDSIEPSKEWVENYIPLSVKPHCFVKPTDDDIDYEAMNQVYCNIVAGACFSIGLRFAGSTDKDACDTIIYYAKELTKFGSKSIGELAGKSTIETCLNLVLISAAMVMAGTGDLQIMRLCRQQRARAGPVSSSLTYGSQLAVHSALGLLFLGAGRYTLSTTPESIGALICAFFPKFPTHSNDNRYHLQAFRHLYVLATEPRLLIPRDITSGSLCYVNVKLVMLDGSEISKIKAPCFLPELHKLKEVHIEDDRYWSIIFKRDRNWDQLTHLLGNLSCIDIKQKAGCLSYSEDPQGFQSLLAQMLTTEKTNVWAAKPENIFAFTNDRSILNLTKHYLMDPLTNPSTLKAETTNKAYKNLIKICNSCYFYNVKKVFERCGSIEIKSRMNSTLNALKDQKICICDKNNVNEREFMQQMAMVTYECVIKDSLAILPIWIALLKILRSMENNPCVYHVWQMKLLFAQVENHNTYFYKDKDGKNHYGTLISNEFCFSMKQKINRYMDSWESCLSRYLKKYITRCDDRFNSISGTNMKKLVSYITFHEVPKGVTDDNLYSEDINLLDLLTQTDASSIELKCLQNIMKILNSDINMDSM